MYVGQMGCTWLPQPKASLWWVPLQGSITKLRHPPARIPASDIHGLRHSRRVAAGVPPVDPQVILYVGKRIPRS